MYIETDQRKFVDRKLSFESGPDLRRIFIQGVRRVHVTLGSECYTVTWTSRVPPIYFLYRFR